MTISEITSASKIYAGSTQASKVYIGDTLVWSALRLPDGYTRLDYIENTSNAYIDTGLVTDATLKVYVEFKKNGSDQYQSVFGSSNASISAPESNFTLQYTSDNIDLWLGNANNQMGVETGVKHTFEGSTTDCKFDDVTKNIVSNYIKSNVDKNLWLFCNNRANTVDAPFKGEIYCAKIYGNDVLVRDYVPCIDTNNDVGMYDFVTQTFYKSPNNTAFIAGQQGT